MEPGSTNPVTYLAGFLIGWGSVIIPLMTIAPDKNDNSAQLSNSVLVGGGNELHSTCELEVLFTSP
jgi:hypothetical protein